MSMSVVCRVGNWSVLCGSVTLLSEYHQQQVRHKKDVVVRVYTTHLWCFLILIIRLGKTLNIELHN